MKRLTFLILLISATAFGQTIERKTIPKLTFSDIHEAFTRIVLNESGWNSIADIGGILQVHLTNTGGRSTNYPTIKNNYGLNYRRLMRFSAAVSPRTFPYKSPWIIPLLSKEEFEKRQRSNGNTYWSSTMKLDCSEPAHWSEVYKEPWSNYTDRCKNLVKITAEFLRGERLEWCRTKAGTPASPQFWGSKSDAKRPEVKTWEEFISRLYERSD